MELKTENAVLYFDIEDEMATIQIVEGRTGPNAIVVFVGTRKDESEMTYCPRCDNDPCTKNCYGENALNKLESVSKQVSAYEKEIWNAAIEAAAKKAKEYLNSKGYKGAKTFAAVMELKK